MTTSAVTKRATTPATASEPLSQRLASGLLSGASEFLERRAEYPLGASMPPAVAEGVRAAVAELDAAGPATPQQALKLAERLVGSYRARDFADAEIFVASLTKVFASYPLEIGRAIVDPVHGLPGRMAFPPSLAEVNGALSDAVSTLRRAAGLSSVSSSHPSSGPFHEDSIEEARKRAAWDAERKRLAAKWLEDAKAEGWPTRGDVAELARSAIKPMSSR